MKFHVQKTSTLTDFPDIEINSIDELMEFVRSKACSIIVSFDYRDEPSLEIYDDCRE